MKILYAAYESANWAIRLCNEMAKRGHEVTCLVQSSDDYEAGLEAQAHENLKVIRIPPSAVLDGNIFMRDVFPIFKDTKFDVAFGSHAPSAMMMRHLANVLDIPWGVMLLDIPSDLMAIDPRRMTQWLIWFEVLDSANTMVFNTYIARDEYARYTNKKFPDENVVVYGTNYIPEYKNAGIDIEGDYVLSICRLVDNKNCIIIPEALALLKGPKKYIAVGRDGGELAIIKRKCEQYGIEFTHYANVTEQEKYELIKNCAALVYPQKTEYIGGLSPFEGLYVGKPVIVPELKVLTDLYGPYPHYFENMNAADLARQLSFAINMDKEIVNLRYMGSDHAEKFADYEQMAEGLLKIMERMKK